MGLSELAGQAASGLVAVLSQPTELLAVASAAVAAALIVISAFVQTIIPLRWLAVGSNAGFIVYGATHPSLLMLVLHATLLPINLYRVAEMLRLTRRVKAAETAGDELGVWLGPYMKTQRLKAGEVLFRKGDPGDRLYFLAEGELEFIEVGKQMGAGHMFGEIAFFAPDRRRTVTARCRVASTVLSLDESTFRQLYFQNPAFGYEVVQLIACRLTGNVRLLEQQLAELSAAQDTPAAEAAHTRPDAPPAAGSPAPRPQGSGPRVERIEQA
jgi:CRP/FNR family cyclic AMP-dependent transcriptional regulator